MLHQVSYQELKSLVLQYPYSPNLRYLLLLKSLFDGNRDFDKNQVLASLTSPDRKKLRQLVKQYSKLRELQENYTLSEEFLELKDLSVLEDLIAEPVKGATETPKAASVSPLSTEPNAENVDDEIEEESDLGFLEGLIGGEHPSEDAEPVPPAPAPTVAVSAVSDSTEAVTELTLEEMMSQGEGAVAAADADFTASDGFVEETWPDAVKEPPVAEELPKQAAADIPLEITNEADLQPTALPKSSFNTWLRKLNPPQAGILQGDLKDISLNSKHLHHPEEEKEPDAKQIADHSVEEDEEIASETLALLLEKQKFYGKAIAMYQRLQLKYPEKSSLFAAKIEELNKKM